MRLLSQASSFSCRVSGCLVNAWRFAFRWRYLKAFTQHPEIRLGKLEACDRNRILDMSFRQHIAPYPYIESFSVDSSDDIKLFEKHVASDRFWRLYK